MGGYKKHAPTVYVVHWPEIGVTKAGYTEQQRWRIFGLRGARLLGLVEFPEQGGFRDAFALETEILEALSTVGARAFGSAAEAEPHLGTRGDGYLECYRGTETDAQALLASIVRALPESAVSIASEMLRTDVRTNATNARITHHTQTSLVLNRARVSSRIRVDEEWAA